MIGRLKERFYVRKYGTERGALILQVEREVASLNSRLVTKEWVNQLWRYPEGAWLDAVELRRSEEALFREREAVVTAVVRRNKALSKIDDATRDGRQDDVDRLKLEAQPHVEELRLIKEKAMESELRFQALKKDFVAKVGDRSSSD